MPYADSLRRRLILWLLGPLVTLAAVGAWQDYRSALGRASAHQDQALLRTAGALAARLDVDADDGPDEDMASHLQRTLDSMQRGTGQDKLAFAVADRLGHLVGGSAEVLALMRPYGKTDDPPGFADKWVGGIEVRAVQMHYVAGEETGQVLVTENTLSRDREAREILMSTLAENALLVLMTLLLVWLGVRLGMRPLDVLSQAVTHRAPDDLDPLPDTGWPLELRPLVLALNQLLADLHEASMAEQAFLSNAAHQLRSPLAGVLAQLELATAEIDGPAQARVLAARQALQQLAHATHQMLTLARAAPQASQGFDFGPVDLPQLLEECASTWLDSAVAQGVELGFEPSSAQLVHGSVWMLREMLGNLVHNSIRHSPRGSEVTVRCGRTHAGESWLEVEDQGPGVPEAERQRIFERFYRVAGTPAGGTGLGLAIVREVADRHHAVITLHEVRDGHGLRVRLRFRAD